MPKLVEEPEKTENGDDDRLLEPKEIEPIRVVLDSSSPSITSIVRVTIVAMVFLFISALLPRARSRSVRPRSSQSIIPAVRA